MNRLAGSAARLATLCVLCGLAGDAANASALPGDAPRPRVAAPSGPATAAATADAPTPISIEDAAAVLFDGEVPAACAVRRLGGDAPAQAIGAVVECMLSERYRHDAATRDLALTWYRASGSVAGVGQAELLDGGYRGQIRLVPQPATGVHRAHLARLVAASTSFDELFRKLGASAAAAPRFRWRNLRVRFVRSIGKRTPSAYAADWTVTYNVRGSLLSSADGVRETLFHEIFHLNDEAHADWSARALAVDYQAIVARCGPALTRACLAPYAPGTTTVRGGTYYAFQQDNGSTVHEYAAELALRYYREHYELVTTGKLTRRPFKCGPPENGRAWQALVTEFFAGIDHTPPCA
jgi:hypothetical protein